MSIFGKGSAPFVIENFNQKPPQWTPGQKISSKIGIDPSVDWGKNKRRLHLQAISKDNPFNTNNNSFSNSHDVNVILLFSLLLYYIKFFELFRQLMC